MTAEDWVPLTMLHRHEGCFGPLNKASFSQASLIFCGISVTVQVIHMH